MSMLHHAQIGKFFEYARERYMIRERRLSGQVAPWTHDPILQQYRFCNVFREHDKVTEWFRVNVRSPMRHKPEVVFACIMFRFINSIATGEELLEANLFEKWDQYAFATTLKTRKDFKKPMLGAAYMIKTPNGMSKISGLRKIFEPFQEMAPLTLACTVSGYQTMESLVRWLVQFPFLGGFMAYEIACDLQYTDWFIPRDTMEWANPGPGAKRGLARLCSAEGRLENNEYSGRLSISNMLQCMRTLLLHSNVVTNWYGHWPRWDMRTVEHTLCEYDKYMRAYHGEGTPKQKFEGR